MTKPRPQRPEFSTLSERHARALLGAHHVGRIAYSFHDRVGIEPIHFAFDGDWIYGRTSAGTKLSNLAHHPWCAFEVDVVRDVFDWESVVVKGTFYLLDAELHSADRYERALTLLREIVPETFMKTDPAPHRSLLFGIHVDEITGRAARLVPVAESEQEQGGAGREHRDRGQPDRRATEP